jgi:signal transduction histidine kinase
MLDGSMRSLGQAEKALQGTTDRSMFDSVATRLRIAQDTLRDMAALLERTMIHGDTDARVFDTSHPLATQVQRIIESLASLAQQHRVDITTQINPAAGQIRAGALGTVIVNALRNAIEACAGSRRLPRRVEFSATMGLHQDLVLLISDNGPGFAEHLAPGQTTKPYGHGLGLVLCRQIVAELGGRMEIVNVPGNMGTVVRVNIPLSRLEKP